MIHKQFTYVFLLLFCIFSYAQETMVTKIVGEKVILEFEAKQNKIYSLYCTNSYGSTYLKPQSYTNKVSFKIPKSFTLKRGVLQYQLIENKKIIKKGNINFESNQNASNLESYLGPPSIEAGGEDFSMLVLIPTDVYDNPLKGYTIELKNQFKNQVEKIRLTNQDVFSYQNYYSPKKDGKMAISSTIGSKNSKELELKIMSRVPNNFQIYTDREHIYADGNQIVTFTTSKIIDEFGNTVSDGTSVNFNINTSNNKSLFINGLTINGIATAKIVHPEIAENWSVNAYVTRISKSDAIEIQFKNAVLNYKFSSSNGNRKITVGPIESYMQQLIPDGFKVTLKIIKNTKVVKEFYGKSANGFVYFDLNKNLVQAGAYQLEITCGGIMKRKQELIIRND